MTPAPLRLQAPCNIESFCCPNASQKHRLTIAQTDCTQRADGGTASKQAPLHCSAMLIWIKNGARLVAIIKLMDLRLEHIGDAEENMKKKAALHLVVLLLTGISSTEVMAGATISDRRYWPNEAIASPSQNLEIAPPYTYPVPLPEPGQPRIRPRRKAQKSR